MDARQVALSVLYQCKREDGWVDAQLKSQLMHAKLDPRDSALATRICFGVVQNMLLLDFYLAKFSSVPLKKMEDRVLIILRIGVYQILFMDKVPHHAIINSCVNMTKKRAKNPRAAGMVNGVLRSVSREAYNLPAIPSENEIEFLSIKYSHPIWLVEKLIAQFGREDTQKILQCHNQAPPITAMVNTTTTTTEKLEQTLATEHVKTARHPTLKNCLLLSQTGDIASLSSFRAGDFYVQDPASYAAAVACGAREGMRILDVCAAPGGKSFSLAMQISDNGNIVSCDLHPHKRDLIEKGANRLHLSSIQAETMDASVFHSPFEQQFDIVLVDAPCSGLGVIRKKPDIRFKSKTQIENLPEIQFSILSNASRYLKKGGTLVYSTCTILKEENEAVISRFVSANKDFTLCPFQIPFQAEQDSSGMTTLLPSTHDTDGFFIAKMVKQ